MIGLPGGLGDGPNVPDWCLRPPEAIEVAAARCGDAGVTLREVEQQLTGLLCDSAGVLGWRGDAATAASARGDRVGSAIDQTAEAIGDAGEALRSLARTVSTEGDLIRALRRSREAVVVRALADMARPRLVPTLTPWDVLEVRDALRDLRRLDQRIEDCVAVLRAADRRAADHLQDVAGQLRRLAALAEQDAWLGTAAPPSVLAVLARYDVVEDAVERRLLDEAARVPAGPEGEAQLRTLLRQLPPDGLAELLQRHPELALRLQTTALPSDAPAGTPETALAAAIAAGAALPPQQRIEGIRRALMALAPDERRRLALLYPAVLGRLDGVPLPDRVAANRVAVAAALEDERRRTNELVRAVRDQGAVSGALDGLRSKVPGVAVDLDTLADAQAHSQKRSEFYSNVLYDEIDPMKLGDPASPRQVLFFDPDGDGRYAEVFGPIDKNTQHVAVFVPGTGTSMVNMDGYANKARWLAREDQSGRTAGVVWAALDLPDAVIADAPQRQYAEAGGPALRDFVWGLDVPEPADITAVGHSYGGAVVGVADREGLPVDKIVHVESAGAGNGVASVEDYASGRTVARYSMTAPGDPIQYTQGRDDFGIGHGADPDELAGITRLETGRYEAGHEKAGQMLEGSEAHTDAMTPDTTAWRNTVGVVLDTEVIPWSPPTQERGIDVVWGPTGPVPVYVEQRWPYQDPAHRDVATIDVP